MSSNDSSDPGPSSGSTSPTVPTLPSGSSAAPGEVGPFVTLAQPPTSPDRARVLGAVSEWLADVLGGTADASGLAVPTTDAQLAADALRWFADRLPTAEQAGFALLGRVAATVEADTLRRAGASGVGPMLDRAAAETEPDAPDTPDFEPTLPDAIDDGRFSVWVVAADANRDRMSSVLSAALRITLADARTLCGQVPVEVASGVRARDARRVATIVAGATGATVGVARVSPE